MALLGGADAFSTRPTFGVQMSSAALRMSDEEAAVAEKPVEVVSKATPKSGLSMKDVRKTVDNLTKENFSESLTSIEPFLLHEAGATIYAKSLRRIDVQAKVLGLKVPEGYASEAKATAKKRAKQDEFIQAKIAEGAAASAEDEVEEEQAESVEEPEVVAA